MKTVAITTWGKRSKGLAFGPLGGTAAGCAGCKGFASGPVSGTWATGGTSACSGIPWYFYIKEVYIWIWHQQKTAKETIVVLSIQNIYSKVDKPKKYLSCEIKAKTWTRKNHQHNQNHHKDFNNCYSKNSSWQLQNNQEFLRTKQSSSWSIKVQQAQYFRSLLNGDACY